MEKPSRAKKIITNIVLVFMLIIFPAMSWVFLNSGANHYRGIMASLGDYGKMPAFNLSDTDGEMVSQEKFDKKLTLMNFSALKENKESFGAMKYVYDQFKDNNGVLFMTIGKDALDSTLVENEILSNGIDPNKWSFLHGNESEVELLKSSKFSMPDSLLKVMGNINNSLILVDTNNIIRNYYLDSDTLQLNRVITTMSLLMPRPEKAAIKFAREKEK